MIPNPRPSNSSLPLNTLPENDITRNACPFPCGRRLATRRALRALYMRRTHTFARTAVRHRAFVRIWTVVGPYRTPPPPTTAATQLPPPRPHLPTLRATVVGCVRTGTDVGSPLCHYLLIVG